MACGFHSRDSLSWVETSGCVALIMYLHDSIPRLAGCEQAGSVSRGAECVKTMFPVGEDKVEQS